MTNCFNNLKFKVHMFFLSVNLISNSFLYLLSSINIYISSVPSIIPEYFLLLVTIINNGTIAIILISLFQNIFQNIN
jgi:hypothetical protein